ncbi:MAG: glycogen synthase GlgA [Pseudoruegeria sp.]
MNLLLIASECAPFVKTGGLADVIGAIPKALSQEGVQGRVLLPLYPALQDVAEKGSVVAELGELFGGNARLLAVSAEGLDLLLLDAPHLYDRPGSIYLGRDGQDWHDNHIRFAALSMIGARIGIEGVDGWTPDVVHAHDWQAGLVPVYMRQMSGNPPPCVMTIHNIAFQGVFGAEVMGDLGLDPRGFTTDGFEYYGRISFLKAGLAHCHKITTVSPTYARELMLPEFGMGLEGLLQARKGDLLGILNGIDTDVWNPETDNAIEQTYSARTLKRKATNREALERRFDLQSNPDAPLFCVISRLTDQKGLDLLIEVLPQLIERGARLALLGSGSPDYEHAFKQAAHNHHGRVGVVIGYDETLSHQMQAGSDAILIPSRFEPCGLTQLYGLRYGTLPVVARTGGLADTIIDANDAALQAKAATGVQFAPVTAESLAQSIDRTCDLFLDQKVWTSMVRNAMKHPVGWDQSARQYLSVFKGLIAS